MRNAYALLGIAFLIVFGGAYILFDRAYAPILDELSDAHNNQSMSLILSSPEFENNGAIPAQYTCDGTNTLPPLSITNVPAGTESFVLVMDDPDIPEAIKQSRGIQKFDHFALYNIPADTTSLSSEVGIGTPALNSRGEEGYTGPCPPKEYEPTRHRYIFRLYALSGMLNFVKAPTLDEVEAAAQGSVLEQATLIGTYERQ